jgi:hypothetical protein
MAIGDAVWCVWHKEDANHMARGIVLFVLFRAQALLFHTKPTSHTQERSGI